MGVPEYFWNWLKVASFACLVVLAGRWGGQRERPAREVAGRAEGTPGALSGLLHVVVAHPMLCGFDRIRA